MNNYASPLLLAMTLALAMPGSAAAQVDVEGATSLSVNGFILPSSTAGFVSANIGLGKFLGGSGFELTGLLNLNMSKFGDDWNTGGYFYGKARYNFIGESTTVPFLEAGFGTPLDKPEGADSFLYQVGAGLKKFVSENVSFDVQGSYKPFIVFFGATYYLGT